MANPLYNIPGLGGYQAQVDANRGAEMDLLRQAAAVGSLSEFARKQGEARAAAERERQARAEMAALGPDASFDQLFEVGKKYLAPKAVLDMYRANETFKQNVLQENRTHKLNLDRLKTDQERAAETARHNKAMEKLGAAGRSSYFAFLPTATGYVAGNTRTGTVEPVLGADGKPIVRAADDPALQGRLSAAQAAGRATGQATAERSFNMEGIGGIIQQAEDILRGVRRQGGVEVPAETPTQSGVGTLVDIAGGFVGMSPAGAAEAQQLKAIGGALTAKMPRMQGPQSDRDVILYREMAAMVGDSTVPIARRLAALETVKQLWAKYETQNPDAFTGAQQPAQPGAPARVTNDAEYNALPSGATYIAPDGKLRRKK